MEETTDRLMLNVPHAIRDIPGWLLWKLEPRKGGGFDKMPYYVTTKGTRNGTQGTPEDRANLVTFKAAMEAFQGGNFDGVGIATLPGFGLVAGDFDDKKGEGLHPEAMELANTTYAEKSPSGKGLRALWLGSMPTTKKPGGGVEVFGSTGFVTITGNVINDMEPVPLPAHVRVRLEALTGGAAQPVGDAAPSIAGTRMADPKQLAELRSALEALPADEYHQWVNFGNALVELGDAGFSLWDEWSRKSNKYDAAEAMKKWRGFKGGAFQIESIFHEAQAAGWKNPAKDAGKAQKGPLSVVFADDLPEAFTPPDELVEGVLTVGGGSVLYGDSNSGKTFFVIDMAAAVARGVPWMGRNTEPGLVVYLAAESPASVRGRLQAYQKHHGVRVPNFAIVQSPIDLFDGEADTDAVIALVRQVELERGQKARLIVGDTLARLSAGANENAGQDMGLVVRRFDRIRNECEAHFMLIHHSGKAAANGARGWSGIRAAVDTEIEVTDSPAVRCAEITKQRDLGTKGQRIGFTLEVLTLGTTKWGAPATSCVVVPADHSDKQEKTLTQREMEGMQSLYRAAIEHGEQDECERIQVPLEAWRAEFYRISTADGQDAKRTAFGRVRNALVGLCRVEVVNDVYSVAASDGGLMAARMMATAERQKQANKRTNANTSEHCSEPLSGTDSERREHAL